MPSPSAIRDALEAQDLAALQTALGFTVSEREARRLWAAPSPLSAEAVAALGAAAARTAVPLLTFQRLLDIAPSLDPQAHLWPAHLRRALAWTLSISDAVTRYLRAFPQLGAPLITEPYLDQAKPIELMRQETRRLRAGSRDGDALAQALRTYRVQEWIRIVIRDLGRLGPLSEILGELSALAQVLIDTATRWHLRRDRSTRGARLEQTSDGVRPAGFAVLAQGKLGGHELNVSSDVDIQFLYSSDDNVSADREALHPRFVRVAQGIIHTLTQPGPPAFCLRVDTDLRPEGRKGPLANSIAGAERYYETWGQGWERLALIRGRHVGGAQWVTDAFLRRVRPFVYRRSLSPEVMHEAVQEAERMMRRGAAAHHRSPLLGDGTPPVDIKRDRGTIREIELFVQLLQILEGGRNPGLQTTSLRQALSGLRLSGRLGAEHAEQLWDCYVFFRRLENAVQACDDRRTHRVPNDALMQAALAAVLRIRGARRPGSLGRAVQRRRQQVQRITGPLFSPARPRSNTAAQAVLHAPASERPQRLAALGFGAPQEADSILQVLETSMGGPFSDNTPPRRRSLAAPILSELAHSPDPDLALRQYVELDRQLRRQPAYYELLETLPVRRRLMDLLGSSEFLGRAIIRNPDLIDWMAQAKDPEQLGRRPGVEALAQMARERCAHVRSRGGDLEVQLRSLRRFKLREQLRVGILDLAHSLDVRAVLTQLCDIAEACLRVSLELTLEETASGQSAGFAVLGLGSLGGGEFGYGSDLDLIFVYEPTQVLDRAVAIKTAQRLIRNITTPMPEGPLFAIDTRLRPSGQQGPLVSSASGFVDYQRSLAMLWERQALLKARPVAGDLALGTRVLQEVADVRYPPQLPPDTAEEMHRLRMRMETELAKPGASNVKTGRGGLVDLEFIVQLCQLRHAHAHPPLRVTGILAALDGLEETGLVGAPRLSRLRESYTFLRFLENRLRIVHNRAIDAFDLAHPSTAMLARRMGYRGAQAAARLRRDYQRVTDNVRAMYHQMVTPPPMRPGGGEQVEHKGAP